ncbi:DUF2017 family protein [Rhabdothermincola sp.]|uniref:DUF2017 family protein n=1 Tax=Rhabdothermincola sp. TaxID=2820405 RepID=UPI002FE3C5F1
MTGLLLVARPDGNFELLASAIERQFLIGLCRELRELLARGTDDVIVRRLFPPAYPHDAEREAFYQQMVRDELRAKHLAALRTIEQTAKASTLSTDELTQWMTAVNALRLVLGTRLDITEDDWRPDIDEDDPDYGAYLAYDVLSALLARIVQALSAD